MSKQVILLYAPAAPWADGVKKLCALWGLRLRPVEPGETGRTLDSLAFGKPYSPTPGGPIPEPLLVLCGFSSAQLDSLLAALRKAGVPQGCLKAVLTPSNANWTLAALYQELCREREQMGVHIPNP